MAGHFFCQIDGKLPVHLNYKPMPRHRRATVRYLESTGLAALFLVHGTALKELRHDILSRFRDVQNNLQREGNYKILAW